MRRSRPSTSGVMSEGKRRGGSPNSPVKGTRNPASLVLGYLAAGQTADEIIAEFPE